MPKNLKRILFVVNKTKFSAENLLLRLSMLAENIGFEVCVSTDFPVNEALFEGIDICCVIGGDGTILSCAKALAINSVPIFGINLGKLGFLATFSEKISDEDFVEILKSTFPLRKRNMLEVSVEDKSYLCLNDLVIKSINISEVSRLRVSINNEYVADYVGDGLIFATPTGSTAYNLSAGGPLIHPRIKAFVMTPICPHTLSNRSIICDPSMVLKVESIGEELALFSDGKEVLRVGKNSSIDIKISNYTVDFIRENEMSHYSILRNKLGWAEDPRVNC